MSGMVFNWKKYDTLQSCIRFCHHSLVSCVQHFCYKVLLHFTKNGVYIRMRQVFVLFGLIVSEPLGLGF